MQTAFPVDRVTLCSHLIAVPYVLCSLSALLPTHLSGRLFFRVLHSVLLLTIHSYVLYYTHYYVLCTCMRRLAIIADLMFLIYGVSYVQVDTVGSGSSCAGC